MKLVGLRSEWKIIDFEASRIDRDWTRLSISVGLPLSSVWPRLDSSLYISWSASEPCLSVTVLCCSAGFVTRFKTEQGINQKFLVKLKEAATETKSQSMHRKTPAVSRGEASFVFLSSVERRKKGTLGRMFLSQQTIGFYLFGKKVRIHVSKP
jgi:hypothetical protein